MYTWWADCGWLFAADSDVEAGLALWPHGFMPREGVPIDPRLEAEALTDAWNHREQ